MSLPGKRDFKAHYGGFWNKIGGKTVENYSGGEISILRDLDVYELCFMDLVKDIEEKCGFTLGKEYYIVCLLDNSPIVIDSDFAVLMIWDVLVSENDNFYHLFVCPSKALVEDEGEGEGERNEELNNIVEGIRKTETKGDTNEPQIKVQTLPNNVTNNGYYSEASDASNSGDDYWSDIESENKDGNAKPPKHEQFREHDRQSDYLLVEDNRFPRREAIGELYEGMKYPTIDECRIFLRKYAILKKFVWKQVYNDDKRLCLDCFDSTCKWLVRIGQIGDGHTMRVKKLGEQHTCRGDAKGRNVLANAKWVAQQLVDDMSNHPTYTPKDIKAEMWERFGLRVSYFTVWNARTLCLELINGNYDEGYKMAPEVCRQIIIKNPGSVAQCHRNYMDNTFKDCCVAYHASIEGFVRGCRPFIGLDGCFLKGKYGGCCLSIIALDANNGLFPIAFYICEGETKDTWTDFLNILQPYLSQHPQPLTFISDRQKGLVPSISAIFPTSSHSYCFRHVYKNFKLKFKGTHLRDLAWGASNSYEETELQQWLELLETADPEAKEYLEKEPRTSWTRAYFDLISKSEHNCNNFSESFNKWILDRRDKPVVQMVEHLQSILMSLFYERRMKASEMNMRDVVPRVHNVIEGYKKTYHKYEIVPYTQMLYVVTRHNKRWIVNLESKTCTCRAWELTGIPCIHAACALIPMRVNWTSWCSHYLTIKSYMNTYADFIYPLPDSTQWEKPSYEVLPPILKRGPGRPKKQRVRDHDETLKSGVRTCKKCGNFGHNSRTCKEETNERRVKQKTDRAQWKGKGKVSVSQGRGESRASATQGRGEGRGSASQWRGRGRGSASQWMGRGRGSAVQGRGEGRGSAVQGRGEGRGSAAQGRGEDRGIEAQRRGERRAAPTGSESLVLPTPPLAAESVRGAIRWSGRISIPIILTPKGTPSHSGMTFPTQSSQN